MIESTRDYHLKRAHEEERLADAADDPASGHSHRDLARLHRMRAEEATSGQARPQTAH